MEFNSDIKLNSNTSDAFDVIISEITKNILPKENFDLFMHSAYLGLTLNEDTNFKVRKDFNIDKRKSIPRIILIQNEQDIKELLLCIMFIMNDFKVDSFDLQKVWNMKTLSSNQELERYLFTAVERGATYTANQIQKKTYSIEGLSKNVDKRIKELEEKISNFLYDYNNENIDFHLLEDFEEE